MNFETDGPADYEFDMAYKHYPRLKKALEKCIAHAGHPDPKEGCRLVVKTADDALHPKCDTCGAKLEWGFRGRLRCRKCR